MRTVIVSGSAGSGTSSVAAALAVRTAAQGGRVALLRSDPMSTAVPSAPDRLQVVDIDPLAWGQRTWDSAGLVRRFAGPPWSSIRGGDVLLLPGLAEAAWWAHLRTAWRSPLDLVVVDAGPIDAAQRWLTLPDTVVGGLRRTWPLDMRASSAAGLLERGSWHVRALARLDSEAADLADRLRAPSTSVHLVVRPTRHDLARVLASLAPLALFELAVTDIVVNSVSGRRRYDAAVVQRLTAHLPAIRIRAAAAHRSPPSPAALGSEVYHDPLPAHKPVRARLRREGDGFSWQWSMPFLDPAGVSASAAGEDAVLTVAGTRRAVALPSVLRRCLLQQVRAADGVLDLGFTPNPDVWPENWESR